MIYKTEINIKVDTKLLIKSHLFILIIHSIKTVLQLKTKKTSH